MTSKSLFFRLIKEDLKRRLWAFGLSFLTFFFAMPVLAAMGVTNLEQQYALWVEDAGNYDFGAGNTAETEFSRKLGELAVESIGLENVVMGFLVITAALVLALTGFLYLHSRKQVDFYHSIPVRREILFTVRFVGRDSGHRFHVSGEPAVYSGDPGGCRGVSTGDGLRSALDLPGAYDGLSAELRAHDGCGDAHRKLLHFRSGRNRPVWLCACGGSPVPGTDADVFRHDQSAYLRNR